jgi:hypothetical protein
MAISFKLLSHQRIRIANARRRMEAVAAWPETHGARDAYLRKLLRRHTVLLSPITEFFGRLGGELVPVIARWAGNLKVEVTFAGAVMKDSAVRGSSFCDLLLLLPPTVSDLPAMFRHLVDQLDRRGFAPLSKGTVISCTVLGYAVDLVPAVRIAGQARLWVRLANNENVAIAVQTEAIYAARRSEEIRLLKVWRDQNGLKFPSIYLETIIIEALSGRDISTSLYLRVRKVLQFLTGKLLSTSLVDPGNPENELGNLMSRSEKVKVVRAAKESLAAANVREMIRWVPREQLQGRRRIVCERKIS